MITIRKISAGETTDFLMLALEIARESEYMTLSPSDRKAVLDLEPYLRQRVDSGRGAVFIAMEDGEMIGYAVVWASFLSKIRHRAQMSVAVRRSSRRRGAGRLLIETAERWAEDHGIGRLELSVAAFNRPALLLAAVMGYRVEGTRRGAVMIEGQAMDAFYMAKSLGREPECIEANFSGENKD